MRAIHAQTITSLGLTLILAAACGGDDSGGGGSNSGPTVTTSTFTASATVTSNTVSTNSATSSGTTTNGSTTNGTGGTPGAGATGGDAGAPGTGGTTGSGATGGTAGGGGEEACDPDPNSGLPETSGEGGGAGAPVVGYDMGYHFTDPEQMNEWHIKTSYCDDCIDTATAEAGCGSVLLTADWPEAANSGTLKAIFEITDADDGDRWDLSGRTVTVRVRWLSGGGTDNNGYNLYFETNDEDWGYMGPSLGELTSPGDFMDFTAEFPWEETDGFDPATIRQMALRFDTKFWTDENYPPTFSYDAEPAVFEIDAIVW